MALLVQKLWKKKNCQNPFQAILRRKKVPTATKPRGGGAGGKGLSATKEIYFFSGFPYSIFLE